MSEVVRPDTEDDDGSPARDPRHVFLDACDVMRRYGWGKTKGYQNLKDRVLAPPPVMAHPDRWRLESKQGTEAQRGYVDEHHRCTPDRRRALHRARHRALDLL